MRGWGKKHNSAHALGMSQHQTHRDGTAKRMGDDDGVLYLQGVHKCGKRFGLQPLRGIILPAL
jgi:hypothetical protein